MATDPVEQIHAEEIDSGFSTDLGKALRQLARLDPSPNVPYLSVYLDWRPEGERPQMRGAKTVFDHRADRLLEQYPDDSEARKSLEQDIQQVKTFLGSGIDPSVHGIIIVANNSKECSRHSSSRSRSKPRSRPARRRISSKMVCIVEDFPRYAVLVADQKDAV
ncbi:MAG: hypothetical protein R2849_15610 [Thermomicrobiales bacterium]